MMERRVGLIAYSISPGYSLYAIVSALIISAVLLIDVHWHSFLFSLFLVPFYFSVFPLGRKLVICIASILPKNIERLNNSRITAKTKKSRMNIPVSSAQC